MSKEKTPAAPPAPKPAKAKPAYNPIDRLGDYAHPPKSKGGKKK